MIRVLLQTTIEASPDDWHIGRFSLLQQLLEQARDHNGNPMFAVTARNRSTVGVPDPVLSTLTDSEFDEVWLFAVDTGNGLTDADCKGISDFRRSGRGLLVARDHMDLGSSICSLAGVGAANHFHSTNQHPDEAQHCIDDPFTTYISWPNYHSGRNGDYQQVRAIGTPHPVLVDIGNAADNAANNDAGKIIRYLPAHPHEGCVDAPADDQSARVILRGKSMVTGNDFNIAVAFEPSNGLGPAITHSTFHHFADYNWDARSGAPSFVSEAPGDTMQTFPEATDSTRRYVLNVARWLAGQLSN